MGEAVVLVSHAYARALVEYGDSLLFGLMGNTNLELICSFAESPGCRYVPVSNESAAVCMASGYASVTGNVGIATVIKGPGVTNTLTALSDAVAARSPLLLIAADAATGVRDDLQKLPQREFVLPTGAGIEQVRTPETALFDLREARRRAVAESRPIVLNVPLDIFKADVEYTAGGPRPSAVGRIAPDPNELDTAVGLIASARRPLILAGRGAASEDARAAILRLSRQLGAPLTTTLRGKDLFRGEPANLGLFGSLSSDRATEAINRADCVIALGTSLNYRTTDTGGLLEGKAVVHCDTSRSVIGRGARVDGPVVGDAGVVADSMVEWLELAEAKPTSFLTEVENLTVSSPPATPKPHRPGTVDFHAALRTLEANVPADRVLTIDNGHFMYSTMKSISVLEPLSYVHTANVGSIGLGLGHALGAAFGARDRPTLLVVGDGGLMCSGIAEFRTAVTNGLDLVVAVMNDAAYGAEYVRMIAHGRDPSPSQFDRPDFAAVAEALGGQGLAVSDDESLSAVAQVIANRTRPLLIDFRLDPDALTKAAVPD